MNIALIAHDSKKELMVQFCIAYCRVLSQHTLVATGTTGKLVSEATGEASKAYLFVATLPYSQYTYVEATADMKQNTWLLCHVHAYDFFGGVAVRCVCDNLKCAEPHLRFNGAPSVMRSSRA